MEWSDENLIKLSNLLRAKSEECAIRAAQSRTRRQSKMPKTSYHLPKSMFMGEAIWNRFLDSIKISVIEQINHQHGVKGNAIHIRDPLGFNRVLVIPLETAEKILVLGLS